MVRRTVKTARLKFLTKILHYEWPTHHLLMILWIARYAVNCTVRCGSTDKRHHQVYNNNNDNNNRIYVYMSN